MKITTISANIRYSQDTGHGAWKVVELGAEATVGEREKWSDAQAELYHQLGQQLKALWSNGQKPAESPVEAAAESALTETPAHYCEEHQSEFKRYSRGENVWYSHKTADGKWCREK